MEKKTGKRRGMDRRTFIKVSGVGIAGLAGGMIPFTVESKPKDILIGDIHPTSGGLAEYGKHCQHGVQLAVEHVNAAGGIKSMGGAKLKLIAGDSEGKPEVGMRAAEKLIQDGVVVINGAFQSSVTFATTQVGEKHRIPTVMDFAMADKILARGYKYCFRLMANTDMASKQWATFTTELAKYKSVDVKTVVIIHENTLYGSSFAPKAKVYIEKAGLKVLSVIAYPYNTADLSSEVSKIKALKPDIIAPISYTPDAILLTKTLASQKVMSKGYIGISSAGHGSGAYGKALGKLAEFNVTQSAFGNAKHPKFPSFAADYKARFGVPPNSSPSCYNYSAGLLIADALERAGSSDPKNIRDAIAKSDFKDHLLCGGPITFDETGQNKNVISPFAQIFNGSHSVVWPKEFALAEPVFPMPSWDKILKG